MGVVRPRKRDTRPGRGLRCVNLSRLWDTCLKINLDADHGGASGCHDYLREIAFDFAWVLREPVR